MIFCPEFVRVFRLGNDFYQHLSVHLAGEDALGHTNIHAYVAAVIAEDINFKREQLSPLRSVLQRFRLVLH